MRKRLLSAIALVAALVVQQPGALAAQQAPAWRDSVARLTAAIRVLGDSLKHDDSTTVEVARRGDLVIRASANDRDAAIDALDGFTQMRERWFGTAMPSPAGFRMVVRTETGPGVTRFGAAREIGTVVLEGLPDTGAVNPVISSVRRPELGNMLIDDYGRLMFGTVPRTTYWLHDDVPQMSIPETERRQRAMYAFVTGMGPLQRGCVGGDATACAYALDLRRSTAVTGVLFMRDMEVDFLLTALSLGGHDAWTRFQAAQSGGMEHALSAAAAMPFDSLVNRWRTGLLALRPAEKPLTPRIGVLACCWIGGVLCLTLGAARWA